MDVVDVDPALAAAVLEIESHAATTGWDQPAHLYALVDTARLVAREPALAASMGLDDASAEGSLTPVEQDQLSADVLEQTLESIVWPDEVAGCAALVERFVLPPGVDDELPDDSEEARASLDDVDLSTDQYDTHDPQDLADGPDEESTR